MFNDNDRLQQMEDAWNSGDPIYNMLGVQADTIRESALIARQEACEHKYKDFRESTAVCLDCDLDVSDVPLSDMEKESLR